MLPKGYTFRGRSPAVFQVALAAVALAVLLVLPFTHAAPPTATVWIADQKVLKQVDPAVNQFIRGIALAQKAEALGIDPSDSALWALSNKHLLKFSATGAPLLDLDLKRLFPGFPDPKYFTLDPYDGSLWVGGEKAWLHLSPTGQKLGEGRVADDIQALGLDTDQTLWVLTKKQLLHLTTQGSISNSLTLKPLLDDPRHLGVDGLGGVIWIAGKKHLWRLDLNDLRSPPVRVVPPASRAPAQDEHEDEHDDEGEFKIEALGIHPVIGTLWAVGKDTLLRYDRNALYLGAMDLKPQALGEIETLAFEPISESLWLGGKALARFTASGAFVAKLPADHEIETIATGPFALRPTLSLLAPQDNSVTNNPRPSFRLGLGAACSGQPCTLVEAYLNSLTLNADLNGVAVGPLFTLGSGEASYTPTTRLPEGLNTLKATAKDVFGHVSNTVTSRFTVNTGVDTIPPAFLSLSPADGSTFTTATVTISGQVDDPTASVMLRNAAGTVLGVGGANFSFAVTLFSGVNAFSLTAQDPAGNTATRQLNYTYIPSTNIPPTVSLTAPVNGATYTAPATIALAANAADSDGSIAKVEFYANAALIGADLTTPYTFNWTNVAAGSYTLNAKATDNGAAVTASTAVNITVSAPANQAPTVSLTAPVNGATYTAPANITLAATASDPDGGIAKLEFLQGVTVIATLTAAPYTFAWNTVAAGNYALSARATDNSGASTTSSAVNVTVGSLLTLAIDSPADGTAIPDDRVTVSGSFQAPANSGVTVNGEVAAVVGNAFYALDVPLQAGANTLTAVLTTPQGETRTQTVTVTGGPPAAVQIAANPRVGTAPLTAVFTVSGVTGAYAWNVNTDGGTLDQTDPSVLFKIAYPVPGVYRPSVTITDSAGNVTARTFVVVVNDAQQMDQLFTTIWTGMNNALARGDVTAALGYLNESAKRKYQPVFTALLPQMPQIIASYSPLRRVLISDFIGEYAINRLDNGQNRLYLIYFLKDPDGVWRLDAM